jgi:hypothetical protein
VAEPLPARPSCPDCGARASARSKACAECGYAFLEDPPRAGRPRRRSRTPAAARGAERRRFATRSLAAGGAERRRFATLSLAAGVLAAATAAALLVALGGGETDDTGPEQRGVAADRVRAGPEVLSRRPLSARAAEQRLEERFVSPRDDDSASARCSALEPRPAHAIRWCRIRYAHGGERTVVVLSNPQGYELLVRR